MNKRILLHKEHNYSKGLYRIFDIVKEIEHDTYVMSVKDEETYTYKGSNVDFVYNEYVVLEFNTVEEKILAALMITEYSNIIVDEALALEKIRIYEQYEQYEQ